MKENKFADVFENEFYSLKDRLLFSVSEQLDEVVSSLGDFENDKPELYGEIIDQFDDIEISIEENLCNFRVEFLRELCSLVHSCNSTEEVEICNTSNVDDLKS